MLFARAMKIRPRGCLQTGFAAEPGQRHELVRAVARRDHLDSGATEFAEFRDQFRKSLPR